MLSILIIVPTHKFVFRPVKLVHTISVKVHKKGTNYKKYKQRNKPITTTAAKRFKIYSIDEFDGILYIDSGHEVLGFTTGYRRPFRIRGLVAYFPRGPGEDCELHNRR